MPRTVSRESKPDLVRHPPHYTRLTPEPIDVLEAWGHVLGWSLCNVIKYVARCDAKGNALQDLEKAKVYLDREIARRKRGRSRDLREVQQRLREHELQSAGSAPRR